MGILDKIKDFGSKIVRGFRGIGEKIRDKINEKKRMKEIQENLSNFAKKHPNMGPVVWGTNPENNKTSHG